MKPLVSIITPSFNSGSEILKAIDSVKAQTFKDWEMIIVDDCSTDETSSKIKSFIVDDDRIKLVELKNNVGSGKARNIAINNAKGRYIAFLDSDDFWATKKLEKQITFMRQNNSVFSYSDYYEFNNKTNQVKSLTKCPEKTTYKMLMRNGGYIGCLTVIYDTYFFGKKYMPEIRKRQDWCLWIKMLKEIDYAHGINEPLAYYRVGNSSLSKNKIKLVKYNFLVYRRELNMSLMESLYRMLIFLLYHFVFKKKSKINL